MPGGFGVRFDSHVYAGYTVSPHYDSMIGKLIVHQPTRDEAIACMLRALSELHIEGIHTTVPLHRQLLAHSAFAEARVDTTFIEPHLDRLTRRARPRSRRGARRFPRISEGIQFPLT